MAPPDKSCGQPRLVYVLSHTALSSRIFSSLWSLLLVKEYIALMIVKEHESFVLIEHGSCRRPTDQREVIVSTEY